MHESSRVLPLIAVAAPNSSPAEYNWRTPTKLWEPIRYGGVRVSLQGNLMAWFGWFVLGCCWSLDRRRAPVILLKITRWDAKSLRDHWIACTWGRRVLVVTFLIFLQPNQFRFRIHQDRGHCGSLTRYPDFDALRRYPRLFINASVLAEYNRQRYHLVICLTASLYGSYSRQHVSTYQECWISNILARITATLVYPVWVP